MMFYSFIYFYLLVCALLICLMEHIHRNGKQDDNQQGQRGCCLTDTDTWVCSREKFQGCTDSKWIHGTFLECALKVTTGLVRWFSGYRCLLLGLKTWVQFPVPTCGRKLTPAGCLLTSAYVLFNTNLHMQVCAYADTHIHAKEWLR